MGSDRKAKGSRVVLAVLLSAGLALVFGGVAGTLLLADSGTEVAKLARLMKAEQQLYFIEADLQSVATEGGAVIMDLSPAVSARLAGAETRAGYTDSALGRWLASGAPDRLAADVPAVSRLAGEVSEPAEDLYAQRDRLYELQPTGRPELTFLAFEARDAHEAWTRRYREAMDAFTADALRELLAADEPSLESVVESEEFESLKRNDFEAGPPLSLLEERAYFLRTYLEDVIQALEAGDREAAVERSLKKHLLPHEEATLDELVEVLIPESLSMVLGWQRDRMQNTGEAFGVFEEGILGNLVPIRRELAGIREAVADAVSSQTTTVSVARAQRERALQICALTAGLGGVLMALSAFLSTRRDAAA